MIIRLNYLPGIRLPVELLIDMSLSAFGNAGMMRDHLPFIGAMDASTSFKHGVAVAPLALDGCRAFAPKWEDASKPREAAVWDRVITLA